MDSTFTVVLGIIAILLPMAAGRLIWKRFDRYFGRNDESYMDTLEYFIKKARLHYFDCLYSFVD
jgi:hypothetical protein